MSFLFSECCTSIYCSIVVVLYLLPHVLMHFVTSEKKEIKYLPDVNQDKGAIYKKAFPSGNHELGIAEQSEQFLQTDV